MFAHQGFADQERVVIPPRAAGYVRSGVNSAFRHAQPDGIFLPNPAVATDFESFQVAVIDSIRSHPVRERCTRLSYPGSNIQLLRPSGAKAVTLLCQSGHDQQMASA